MAIGIIQDAEARAKKFRQLHEQKNILVLPNPWDAGSAKILASLGFQALATTSAGLAFSLGLSDGHGEITRQQTLQNSIDIINATNLPVAADLENGFGDDPEACAETIRLAAAAGLSGGSIEDATGRPQDPIYEFCHAVDRVKAAVAAARKLPIPFILTARAENLIYGRKDLPDTIRRLQAFAEAGADVLFAPGLATAETITTVVKEVAPHPLHVVMGLSGGDFSLAKLEDLGVKRVSLGSSLSRAALTAFYEAAEEIIKEGRFSFASKTKPYHDWNTLFGKKA